MPARKANAVFTLVAPGNDAAFSQTWHIYKLYCHTLLAGKSKQEEG